MGREEMHTRFWCVKLRERDHLKDRGVDGKVILKWVFRKCCGGMDWIDLAQNRNEWQAFVNGVMNNWVSQNGGIF
jgi:hypothetical protein